VPNYLRDLLRCAAVAALILPLAGCPGDDGSPAEGQAPDAAAADAEPEAPPEPEVQFAFGSTAADAQACQQRRQEALNQAAQAAEEGQRFRAGENPVFAVERGWWPEMEFRDGAIFPCSRVVVYYGNPNSRRMGALGQYDKPDMLNRLRRQVAEWEQADSETPVVPGLHMVAVVAQADAGPSGHYRAIARDADVEMVYGWAQEVNGIFFVDIQVGTDDIRNILPRFDWILQNPDVHLGVDPEFMMKDGSRPGSRIGTMDAADVNYVTEHLANLVREHNLPPKIFILHRFTQRMVTNHQNIQLRPEVQIINHMDGWGPAWLKRDSYRDFMVREPIQFPGFKIFYDHDQRQDPAVMSPRDLLQLWPQPIYVQYQ
jgi:hypothetical protein